MIQHSNTTPVVDLQTNGAAATAVAKETAEESPVPGWRAPWRFALHTCVGALIFATVALPAILLNWSMEWMESVHRTDPIIILGLRFVEYGIFGCDVLMLGVFLFKSCKRTIREL